MAAGKRYRVRVIGPFVASIVSAAGAWAGSAAATPPDEDSLETIVVLGDRVAAEQRKAAFEAKKQRIDAALAAEGRGDWDGVYSDGNGYDWRELAYAQAEGFAYRAGTCTGGYASIGEVDADAGGLHLKRLPQGTRPMMNFLAEPEVLLPIAWGARRYLVAESQIGQFALDVHSGGEPRCNVRGGVLLRSGDERLVVSGLPELPARWQGLLRREALVLHVTALTFEEEAGIGGSRHLRYTLTFDGGADRGLLVGATLRPLHPRMGFYGNAAVIAVGAHEATAQYEHWVSAMNYANEFGLLPASGGSHPIDDEVVGPALGIEFTTGALPADIDAPHCDPSAPEGAGG